MHWHAYAYTGGQWPLDREARNLQSPVPPNTIGQWFRKPQSMRVGTFTDPEQVFAWLKKEVHANPPRDPDGKLAYLRDCVERRADAYAGYYSRGQVVVRCALVCPRTGERCPDPPR
ncbi:hypothetical protein [Streptomyces axinellae]|uniref:Uncharacterized protein n=1 Tax=Streptomyces axinellae TaxID=552788 RepID=A0ABP6C802_9ACTN